MGLFNLMCDARSHLSQRGQLLRLNQLILRPLKVLEAHSTNHYWPWPMHQYVL